MATHSSVLAWRIPWTEGPGGLQSTGSQRVRHEGKQLVTHAGKSPEQSVSVMTDVKATTGIQKQQNLHRSKVDGLGF